MNTVKIFLTICLVLSAIGCSRNTMVGLDDSATKPSEAANLVLCIKPVSPDLLTGGMKKTTALVDYSPSYAIVTGSVTSRDSIPISGGAITVTKNYTVTKGAPYSVVVKIYSLNQNSFYINNGSASGTVPDSTSFTVNISCSSTATNYVVNLTMGATSSPIATGATLSWTQTNTAYQPVSGSSTIAFPTGTTSAALNGLIYLMEAPNSTTFLTYLVVPCSDGGSYQNNVVSGVSQGDAVSLTPGVSQTKSYTMTKIGGTGTSSLLKASVTYGTSGTVTVSAALPKQK